MVIDYTVTMGNIIEMSIIAGGGVIALLSMKSTVNTIKDNVDAMQAEIIKLAAVVTQMAVANNRLDHIEEDIRELKHYRGFVAPGDANSLHRGG